MVFYPQSIPASLEQPVKVRSGNWLNFVMFFLFFFFKGPIARLVGTSTITHTQIHFSLPCAGLYHKIHIGYEATTTTNLYTCLAKGYYTIICHFNSTCMKGYYTIICHFNSTCMKGYYTIICHFNSTRM